MFTKIIFAAMLLACSSGRISAVSDDLQPLMQQHQDVMRSLVNTLTSGSNRLLSDQDIQSCFSYYDLQQQQVMAKYNADYLACVQTGKDARNALTEQNAEQRAEIVGQGTDLCTQLSSCQQDEDALEFFQCTYKTSNAQFASLLNISSESSNIVNDIQVQYQKIENDENICTTTARNEYSTGLADTATVLNQCLAGEVTPPNGNTTPIPSDTTTTEPEEITTEPAEITTEPAETSEPPPEEDLRYRPMTRMNMWNMLRHV